jgi:large conductance mechanosensitive channel
MSMLKDFRDFAIKGNVVDLAIGVIIGAAFGTIVSSLVDDVFMPVIGLVLGRVDFANLFIVLNNPNNVAVTSLAAAKEAGLATLNIGLFINAVVKFTIVAFVLFLVVKGINTIRNKQAAAPPAQPPAPTKEEVLLTEIRDALRGKTKSMPMAAAKAPSVSAKAATAAKAPVKKAAAKKAPAKKAAAKKAPAKKAAAKKAPAKKAAAKKPAAPKAKAKAEKPKERKPIVRTPRPIAEPGRKQERRGVVVSDKGDKTIIVKVDVIKSHPKYKKVIRRTAKFHAHDEANTAGIGDTVRIIETRPLSKTKRWRLAEIVEKAR